MGISDGHDGQTRAADASATDSDAAARRHDTGDSGDDRYWLGVLWRDATCAGATSAVQAAREAISEWYAAEGETAPRYAVSIRFTALPASTNEEG